MQNLPISLSDSHRRHIAFSVGTESSVSKPSTSPSLSSSRPGSSRIPENWGIQRDPIDIALIWIVNGKMKVPVPDSLDFDNSVTSMSNDQRWAVQCDQGATKIQTSTTTT